MAREAEEAGEQALEGLKQRVFASAFGSFNPPASLKQYYELFEKPEEEAEDYEVEEFEPENEEDVQTMLNTIRRAGVIN